MDEQPFRAEIDFNFEKNAGSDEDLLEELRQDLAQDLECRVYFRAMTFTEPEGRIVAEYPVKSTRFTSSGPIRFDAGASGLSKEQVAKGVKDTLSGNQDRKITLSIKKLCVTGNETVAEVFWPPAKA